MVLVVDWLQILEVIEHHKNIWQFLNNLLNQLLNFIILVLVAVRLLQLAQVSLIVFHEQCLRLH